MPITKSTMLPFDLNDYYAMAVYFDSRLNDYSTGDIVKVSKLMGDIWSNFTKGERLKIGRKLSIIVSDGAISLRSIENGSNNHKRYIVT